VVLSPDGRLLATVGSDDSLRVWEVPTGARVWALAPEAGRHTINPVFSPDGTRLLVCSWLEPPRVVEIATGETIISPIVMMIMAIANSAKVGTKPYMAKPIA